MLSIPIPTGYTGVAPQVTSTATSYDTGSNYWATYQPIAVGATSLSVVTFITAGIVALPAGAAVSSPVFAYDFPAMHYEPGSRAIHLMAGGVVVRTNLCVADGW